MQRDRRVTVRLNETEFAILQRRCGPKGMSRYLRNVAVSGAALSARTVTSVHRLIGAIDSQLREARAATTQEAYEEAEARIRGYLSDLIDCLDLG
jgi:hypothetical protein